MQTYSLFELNEYLRRIIALNFPVPIWVKGEIGQVGSSRGHYYLELVEKATESDEILAQCSAVLWQNNYRSLKRKLGKTLDGLLQEGMEVQLKVRVNFHERYGLKLIVEEIDPVFTLGKLALQKQQILEKLQQEHLLEINRQLSRPPVLQNLAIISSVHAAGYQDFVQQLLENPYGYQYYCRLFPAAMQGQEVEKEVLRQFKTINRRHSDFDAVIIIRGGGSRLDLAAFDNLALGKAVAKCPLPVITGIGHDIDDSVLDKVAHLSLKTPTAVADFLIQQSMMYESQLIDLGNRFANLSSDLLANQQLNLQLLQQRWMQSSRERLNKELTQMETLQQRLQKSGLQRLKTGQKELDQLEKLTQLLSLDTQLKRGFSLTLREGQIVKNIDQVSAGDQITTIVNDGKINSTVSNKTDKE